VFGVFGISALLLRELLQINLFDIRHQLRGFVGTDVGEFNTRLLHVAMLTGVAAAFARFD